MNLEALRFWDDPVKFNAGASASIVLIAIFVTWRYARNNEPRFKEDAHIAWLLYWLASFATFVTIPRFFFLKLLLLDGQSFLAIAFFWIVLHGDKYVAGPIFKRLGVFIVVWFVLRTILLFRTSWDDPNYEFFRVINTLPTQALSSAGLVMLGGILALRYGEGALFLVIAAAAYAICQQPLYYSEFIRLQAIPNWWFWPLGFSKYALAATFYWFFLTPLTEYERKHLPSPTLRESVGLAQNGRQFGSPVWTVIIAATGHFIGAFVAGLVR